jgi:plastocyanin
MVRRHAATLITVLSLGVLAGCGSSSSSKAGNATATTKRAVITTPKVPAPRKAVHIVNEGSSYAYKPKTITIKAGTIVTWTNQTTAAHTVTFTGRGLPSSSVKAGSSLTAEFTRSGTFAYHCTIHPYMKGAIIVKAR